MSSSRRASHSGSWYSSSGRELNEQLEQWLSAADASHTPARAIIAPHAGYSYCGACGGFAYRQVSAGQVRRVFILGPSHHVRLSGCALSSVQKYQTPLYDLTIDQGIYKQLYATDQFEPMSLTTDEDEHSIEMHLPYIAKVMENYKSQFTIVPVLVGSLTPQREALYGRIFAEYLTDPANLFVISSDFCHWGQRFRYTSGVERGPAIHEHIEQLDREAMRLIEEMQPRPYTEYLQRTGNTICGRHPIGVLLNSIATIRDSNGSGADSGMQLKFLQYAQSSQCRSKHDSSVSYASASLVFQ